MENKYIIRSRISEKKTRQIIRCFAKDLTAAQTAAETHITRKTINTLFTLIRQVIFFYCQYRAKRRLKELNKKLNITEDELIYGLRMTSIKNAPKTKLLILSILFTDGHIQSEVIRAPENATLQDIQKRFIDVYAKKLESFIVKDFPYALRYKKEVEIDQLVTPEIFFSRRLKKFKGIAADKLVLHVKETEWRINFRDENLYTQLLQLLRNNPISTKVNFFENFQTPKINSPSKH